ncbi:uncharacterized protein B0P05DRAFT_311954 [Gilbertella persicaria]|uniref:uncharacterized protein n=1 Tax=Gilbertella persicaria TaxID=101096 RepID=UPI00221F10EC|nr:uncharacterized protein B0P05DRAFT_311954 [Gilbertella persicaria]KAI8051888.1 hypothetical protein B0P05DRAFT_311954 [Gilbertella persicaria]
MPTRSFFFNAKQAGLFSQVRQATFFMLSFDYKIYQASARNLLFRRCGNCQGNVVFAMQNEPSQLEDSIYCPNCKKMVTNCKIYYKLGLVVVDIVKNKFDAIIAYERVAEALIGCSAETFLEHWKQDPSLSQRLEDRLVGMYCTVSFGPDKKTLRKPFDDNAKRAKSIQLRYQENVNLIDIVLNTKHEIKYSPSIMAD